MVALKQDNKYDDNDDNNIKKGPKLFVNYIRVTVSFFLYLIQQQT